MTTARSRLALVLYSAAICLLGCGALVVLWQRTPPLASARELLLFILLSICIKNLGFQVSQDVTHSLVGVVDLAVLFMFGPSEAGLVAVVSGGLCQIACFRQHSHLPIAERLSHVLLSMGLNALMILAAGWVYRLLGGAVPLAQLTWSALGAVLVACCTWFTLDHVGWTVAEWLLHGWKNALRFVRHILPYSLRVELAPLPFSVLMTAAYVADNPLILMLMVLAILAAGLILRKLMVSLSEERRHVQELSTINSLSEALLGGQFDRDEMCRLVYGYCGQVVDISNFCLQVRDPRTHALDIAVLAIDGRLLSPKDYAVGDGVLRWMETARRPVLAASLDSLPFAPLNLGQPARSGLYVPIVMGDELLGVIALQSPQSNAFSAEDERFLVLAASHAALGLHTAQLYLREQGRASQLVAISQVSRKVAAILDLKTLLADTVKLVQETFGYYHVSILTVESERQQVTFRASSSTRIQERGIEVLWGQGIIGHVATTGQSLLVNDVRSDVRYLSDTGLEETRAELAVPLKVEERILGVLDVQCNRVGALSEEDMFILLTLADQIAIAIEDSRLYEEQQELAWVSTALLQMAQAVGELSTPEEVLDTTIRLTPMLTGVEHCVVFLWSEEETGFVAVKSAGLTPKQMAALQGQVFATGSMPVLDLVRRQGQSITCVASEFECFLPSTTLDASNPAHVIALPLRSQGQTIGVLVAQDASVDQHLTAHRQTMLTSIANQTALALENARLYTAEREEAWVSTALLQVANIISTHTDLDQAISSVLRLAPILVGIQWCALWLWDEEKHAFHSPQTYGLPEETAMAFAQPEAQAEAIPLLQQIAVQQGNAANMHSITTLDPVGEGLLPASIAERLGANSLTALPLHIQERLLGVLLVAHPEKGKHIAERRMSILDGIAHQIALAIEASQFYQQAVRQQRLEREMELARGIQESFLPECCPTVPGWQFSVEWRAARGVGGDFYDLIPLDAQHLGLLIADVSDKGVAAALYMALSRTVVRIVAKDTLDPAETLKHVNRILLEDSRSGMFVSMFYAVLELGSGQLTYARAGHNPPLVVRAADRSLMRLSPPGVVLGILEEPTIDPGQVQLTPGDALVLYTDGVTEAEDGENNEFGEERLQEVLRSAPNLAAEALVLRISAAVRAFTGERPQFDDLTLMAVVREGA